MLVVSFVLSGAASIFVHFMHSKYSKVQTKCGITTNQFLAWMFIQNGIDDVRVTRVSGELTDYYSNSAKTVALSAATYNESSVAAIGVAAHEAGHAVQYKRGYIPVLLRTFMAPVVNIGSPIGVILCVIGTFFSTGISDVLTTIGLILYALAFVLSVVTLPVEFNASRRAIKNVKAYQGFTKKEISGMRMVLIAAALTYVASMLTSLLHLLRLVFLFGRRRD